MADDVVTSVISKGRSRKSTMVISASPVFPREIPDRYLFGGDHIRIKLDAEQQAFRTSNSALVIDIHGIDLGPKTIDPRLHVDLDDPLFSRLVHLLVGVRQRAAYRRP